MPESTVKIVNPLGLHARAAAKLVRLAGEYQSSITIEQPGAEKNGRREVDRQHSRTRSQARVVFDRPCGRN
jgi:hypothetical protein